jgi:hypothetical protein
MLFFDLSKQEHPLNVINESSMSSRAVGPVHAVNTKNTNINNCHLMGKVSILNKNEVKKITKKTMLYCCC